MISVCIATYNGATYLAEQLQSIVSQLTAGDEIIISDDGSTDSTLTIIEQFIPPSGINLLKVNNTGEHGYIANFEHALRHAQGDFIFLADQDDVWLPNKVRTMLDALSDAQCLLAVSNASITDARLQITNPDYFAARGVHRGLWGNLFKFGYLGCCFAFRRQLLNMALPFPADRRYCTHDQWLYLCASCMGDVRIIDNPLLLYRRHADTSTTGELNAHKPLSFRIRYRLYVAWQLMYRLATRKQ